MKRLANLKNSSSDSPEASNKRNPIPMTKRKGNNAKNNPYSISGARGDGDLSFSAPLSGQSDSFASPSPSRHSLPASSDGPRVSSTAGTKSGAPTLSTNGDTTHSDAAPSKAGTSATAGGGISSNGGGEGSTFSSPAPSVRSLTTTLTTVQSAAASTQLHTGGNTASHGLHPTHTSQFSHQFPMASPASAVPQHLVPHGHPTTYNSATANNLLTDNASILTLASSSKRRRRNSLDTNASVRALAPSSIFGGSRESLPLSLLSTNITIDPSTSANAMQRPSIGGVASAERTSIYSASGVVPTINSERNSFYASKQPTTGDGASVRSGLQGHGRNDSVTGSIGGTASPLASPVPGALTRGPSRRSSGWGEVPGEEDDEDETDEEDGTRSELDKSKTTSTEEKEN